MKQVLGNGKNISNQLGGGEKIRQWFQAAGNCLEALQIGFVTFKRRNNGQLRIDLLDWNNKSLGSYFANLETLKDNSLATFKMRVVLEEGKIYQLVISATGNGNSVAVKWGHSPTTMCKLACGMGVYPQSGVWGCLIYGQATEQEAKEQEQKVTNRLNSRLTKRNTSETIVGMISVVVPYYNTQKYLLDCLKYLNAQTYNFFEVIVVNDCSTEPIPPISEIKSCCHSPLCILSHEHNRGASAARNTGFSSAIGEYLFFLDSDVFLQNYALEALLNALLENPNAAFAYGNFQWGKNLIAGGRFNINKLKEKNYISTMSMIRRKNFPGFDESLKRHQDWDLWLTIAERGGEGIWVDEMLFETPMRANSISAGVDIDRNESMRVVRTKHGI